MTFTRVISAVLLSFLSVFASATVMTDDDAEREVREQAARMLIVGFRGDTIGEDVRHYVADLGVGGVILFDSDLTLGGGHGTRNIRSPRQLKSLCDGLKRLAGSDLLIAVDEEGGKVSRLKHVYGFPSTVKRPLPSSTVTRASPPEAWVLISSPFSKANRVRLTLSFCTRVRLTICPSLYATSSLSFNTSDLFIFLSFPSIEITPFSLL